MRIRDMIHNFFSLSSNENKNKINSLESIVPYKPMVLFYPRLNDASSSRCSDKAGAPNKREDAEYIAKEAERILVESYGDGASFRSGQLDAIINAVSGKRVLVVEKTGWGKSAVYFIATRILRSLGYGPTLVISPLLALMDNQIEAAKRFGVDCRTINSTNRQDWDKIYDDYRNGRFDLMIVSPERLSSNDFIETLRDVKNPALVVIDEAHCISDWGHDFRPDYQRIIQLINELGVLPYNVGIIGTTATANERVVRDVKNQFGYNAIVVRGVLMRNNLAIQIIEEQPREVRLAWLGCALTRGGIRGITYEPRNNILFNTA